MAKGDHAAAEKLFEEAIAGGLEEGSPDRSTALEGLASIGVAHGQARRFAEAERVFRRLAALDPRSAPFRMYLGLSLRRLGRYEDAEKEYLAAVEGIIGWAWWADREDRAALTAAGHARAQVM